MISPVFDVPSLRSRFISLIEYPPWTHIQAFPYFYVPYDEDLPTNVYEGGIFLRQLAIGLNAALQESLSPPQIEVPPTDQAGNATSTTVTTSIPAEAHSDRGHHGRSARQRPPGKQQFVHNTQIVKAIPIYGYHPKESLFIKIMLYNPQHVARASLLLQSGLVMKRCFQPYESHVPFLLQIKIDLNLFGMGHIRLSRVLFRDPLPIQSRPTRKGWRKSVITAEYEETDPSLQLDPQSLQQISNDDSLSQASDSSIAADLSTFWTTSSTSSSLLWSNQQMIGYQRPPKRQTTCQLEADGVVEHVLNRGKAVRVALADAAPTDQLQPSLLPMWEEESERCGGHVPLRPSSPPRSPAQLCPHVERDVSTKILSNLKSRDTSLWTLPAPSVPATPASPSVIPGTPVSMAVASPSSHSVLPDMEVEEPQKQRTDSHLVKLQEEETDISNKAAAKYQVSTNISQEPEYIVTSTPMLTPSSLPEAGMLTQLAQAAADCLTPPAAHIPTTNNVVFSDPTVPSAPSLLNSQEAAFDLTSPYVPNMQQLAFQLHHEDTAASPVALTARGLPSDFEIEGLVDFVHLSQLVIMQLPAGRTDDGLHPDASSEEDEAEAVGMEVQEDCVDWEPEALGLGGLKARADHIVGEADVTAGHNVSDIERAEQGLDEGLGDNKSVVQGSSRPYDYAGDIVAVSPGDHHVVDSDDSQAGDPQHDHDLGLTSHVMQPFLNSISVAQGSGVDNQVKDNEATGAEVPKKDIRRILDGSRGRKTLVHDELRGRDDAGPEGPSPILHHDQHMTHGQVNILTSEAAEAAVDSPILADRNGNKTSEMVRSIATLAESPLAVEEQDTSEWLFRDRYNVDSPEHLVDDEGRQKCSDPSRGQDAISPNADQHSNSALIDEIEDDEHHAAVHTKVAGSSIQLGSPELLSPSGRRKQRSRSLSQASYSPLQVVPSPSQACYQNDRLGLSRTAGAVHKNKSAPFAPLQQHEKSQQITCSTPGEDGHHQHTGAPDNTAHHHVPFRLLPKRLRGQPAAGSMDQAQQPRLPVLERPISNAFNQLVKEQQQARQVPTPDMAPTFLQVQRLDMNNAAAFATCSQYHTLVSPLPTGHTASTSGATGWKLPLIPSSADHLPTVHGFIPHHDALHPGQSLQAGEASLSALQGMHQPNQPTTETSATDLSTFVSAPDGQAPPLKRWRRLPQYDGAADDKDEEDEEDEEGGEDEEKGKKRHEVEEHGENASTSAVHCKSTLSGVQAGIKGRSVDGRNIARGHHLHGQVHPALLRPFKRPRRISSCGLEAPLQAPSFKQQPAASSMNIVSSISSTQNEGPADQEDVGMLHKESVLGRRRDAAVIVQASEKPPAGQSSSHGQQLSDTVLGNGALISDQEEWLEPLEVPADLSVSDIWNTLENHDVLDLDPTDNLGSPEEAGLGEAVQSVQLPTFSPQAVYPIEPLLSHPVVLTLASAQTLTSVEAIGGEKAGSAQDYGSNEFQEDGLLSDNLMWEMLDCTTTSSSTAGGNDTACGAAAAAVDTAARHHNQTIGCSNSAPTSNLMVPHGDTCSLLVKGFPQSLSNESILPTASCHPGLSPHDTDENHSLPYNRDEQNDAATVSVAPLPGRTATVSVAPLPGRTAEEEAPPLLDHWQSSRSVQIIADSIANHSYRHNDYSKGFVPEVSLILSPTSPIINRGGSEVTLLTAAPQNVNFDTRVLQIEYQTKVSQGLTAATTLSGSTAFNQDPQSLPETPRLLRAAASAVSKEPLDGLSEHQQETPQIMKPTTSVTPAILKAPQGADDSTLWQTLLSRMTDPAFTSPGPTPTLHSVAPGSQHATVSNSSKTYIPNSALPAAGNAIVAEEGRQQVFPDSYPKALIDKRIAGHSIPDATENERPAPAASLLLELASAPLPFSTVVPDTAAAYLLDSGMTSVVLGTAAAHLMDSRMTYVVPGTDVFERIQDGTSMTASRHNLHRASMKTPPTIKVMRDLMAELDSIATPHPNEAEAVDRGAVAAELDCIAIPHPNKAEAVDRGAVAADLDSIATPHPNKAEAVDRGAVAAEPALRLNKLLCTAVTEPPEQGSEDVVIEDCSGLLISSTGLICLRPRSKPPSPEEALISIRADYGLMSVVHQEPFYGNLDDVPPRPTVFAGREFRIPSSVDIPHFLTTHPLQPLQMRSETVPAGGSNSRGRMPHIMTFKSLLLSQYPQLSRTSSMIAATKLSLGTRRQRGLAFTPAIQPPSSTEINAWLTINPSTKMQRALLQSGSAYGRGNVQLTPGAHDGDTDALFQLDPNTGALLLVPTHSNLSVAISQAGGEAVHHSTPYASPPVDGLGSLLGTPDLILASAIASLPEVPSDNHPDHSASRAREGPEDPRGDKATNEEESYEVDGVPFMRPASPKYDQRSGFYQESAPVPVLVSDPDGSDRFWGKSAPERHDTSIFRPGVVTAAPSQRNARLKMQISLQQSVPARRNLGSSFQTPLNAPPDGSGYASGLPSTIAPTPGPDRAMLISSNDNVAGMEGHPTSLLHPRLPASTALDCSQQLHSLSQQQNGQQQQGSTPQDSGKDSGMSSPEPAAAAAVPCILSAGETLAAPPSAFKGTATLRTQAQQLSLISPLKPQRGPSAATPPSQRGFRRAEVQSGEQMTVLAIEVMGGCRSGLLPDPKHDKVRCILLMVMEDGVEDDIRKIQSGMPSPYLTRAMMLEDERVNKPSALNSDGLNHHERAVGLPSSAVQYSEKAAGNAPNKCGDGDDRDLVMKILKAEANNEPTSRASGFKTADALMDCHQVEYFKDETAMLEAFCQAVLTLDPDVIMGWEMQKGSLGYLAERANVLSLNLLRKMSRTPETASFKERQDDEYGRNHASGLHCTGRVLLNLWRIMRGELKLGSYTFENCVAAILRLRVPCITLQQLAAWFSAGPALGRWRVVSTLVRRCRLSLAMVSELDLLGRTAEMARTFGIDLFSVLSRGSQYRVESMLLRLAHSQNYLAPSPSREQVGSQPALEALPLILEPESRMYCSPVIVLDFQSLYPSLVIAYNLCYSTCLGRPQHAAASQSHPIRLGCMNYAIPQDFSQTLCSAIHGNGSETFDELPFHTTPNGMAYVKPAIRPGVLPRMLSEILDTRIMVKAAMKRWAARSPPSHTAGQHGAKGSASLTPTPFSRRVLQRILNARQFSLKMIANVTYGYTSASFSGRMPFAELADSIVETGRHTLQSAMDMVNSHPTWGARVVYGDTDSMFVLMEGRSREDAFTIGAEIAAAVTAANPAPVTLKMEKVYHPCVLQTKKRYVGLMYESAKQAQPSLDAKGIESVRRDSCPAVTKMLEQSLRLLFTCKDLSKVKSYVEQQWSKILSNRVSIQDFVFCREVRLGTYSVNAATIPPAAVVATRAMAMDPRAEPLYAERVPFVVVYGQPGSRLVDQAVDPKELVESGGRLRLNAVYYITKQIIPALERVFSLVGADVRSWFAAMPRSLRMVPQKRPASSLGLHQADPAPTHMTRWQAHKGPLIEQRPTLFGRSGRGLLAPPQHRQGVMEQYWLSRHCAVCDELTMPEKPLCLRCIADPVASVATLMARVSRLERQHTHMVRMCLHCGGGGGGTSWGGCIQGDPVGNTTSAHPVVAEAGSSHRDDRSVHGIMALGSGTLVKSVVCESLDCGIYFERSKLAHELKALAALAAATCHLFGV
ncbi:hypothetical protein CEUSTIGMA_g7632.t1 [Chlamydomonas eustigma]|uniref:DNA polymerase zeta catalytic subunit n=1 Tax=Chlamydomonas eustigma TaxID=1157962 RepID=A0A250XAU5_9CHLO|nr:hypothetical protein CEUSTIGMA_g7632.t1 [Chlamydomonas eustigma]|eukprot:GAX80194.1 hypothetical protein CEUSTIGMA_g7632.t1 [Chlamydomonas eustigma]